jgi:hypothetical protein
MIAMTMAVVLRLLNNLCAPEKLTLIEWHLGDPASPFYGASRGGIGGGTSATQQGGTVRI